MKNVRLYACGGMGLGVGKAFIANLKEESATFARILPAFIDTSDSDLTKDMPAELVYLVEGMKGCGFKRDAVNYGKIKEKVNDILHTFEPSELNIVIHSLAGGTGSMVGPTLVSELLARGELVVVLTVGSTATKIQIQNTIDTLKSYEAISNIRKVPVLMAYNENSKQTPPEVVDHRIRTFAIILATLFSGNNRKLDSADLNNFINYHNVTSFKPKLCLLEFAHKDIVQVKGQPLISVVTLTDDKTDHQLNTVEYQAVGYLSEEAKKDIDVELPIHVSVTGEYFKGVVDRLEEAKKVYEENRKVVSEKSIIGSHDSHTDDGIVFS